MSKNNGGPAFPMPIAASADGGFYSTQEVVGERFVGMTLRDYFAAKAMQGFCANPSVFARDELSGWALVNATEDKLSGYAYYIADAMLQARDA